MYCEVSTTRSTRLSWACLPEPLPVSLPPLCPPPAGSRGARYLRAWLMRSRPSPSLWSHSSALRLEVQFLHIFKVRG